MNSIEMFEKFAIDKTHAQEVERLSLIIFDEVQKINELSNRKRRCLQAGALLHDIGYYQKGHGHNKHSQQMILEQGLDDFEEKEKSFLFTL